MALHKNPKTGIYHVDVSVKKHRVQRTADTTIRRDAQQLHDEIKSGLWRKVVLKEKPRKTWDEAVTEFERAKSGKRSIQDDRDRLLWVMHRWTGKWLDEITGEELLALRGQRARVPTVYYRKDGTQSYKQLQPATLNRYMAAVSGVLHFAKKIGWLSVVPTIEDLDEDNERIAWATVDQAQALIRELPGPSHKPPNPMRNLARYALATGVRKSNCSHLEWAHVNLSTRRAFVPGTQFKNGQAFAYPLNDDAAAVLEEQVGKHARWVFPYNDEPIADPYTAAFKKAAARAGLNDFHWHDLRHTWATWHAMSGTPIHVLKDLGGWKTLRMVERYYHLAESFTAQYAQNVSMGVAARNVHIALTKKENRSEESVKSIFGEELSSVPQAVDSAGGVADGTHDNRNHNHPAD